MNLTRETAPTNPAFIGLDVLLELKERGVSFFVLTFNKEHIGFMAIENSGDSKTYYLEKLAVMPEHRHKGYAKMLLDHACRNVKLNSGQMISIGIINKNCRLKKWYKNYGFKEIVVKQYDHLPFDVCFMSIEL